MYLRTSHPRAAGFGILEAMIMVAVSSIIITGVSSLLSINNYYVRQVNFQAQREALGQSLTAQLADSSICSAGINKSLPFDSTNGATTELGFQALGSNQNFVAGSIPAPNLVIRKFYLANLRPTNLVGFSGGLMQTGDLFLDVQSTAAGVTVTPPLSLGTLFVEVSSGHVSSCFNNNGPLGASVMACLQISGSLSSTTSACDLSPFAKSVQQTIYDQVHSELYGIYDAWIMGNTDGILSTVEPQTLRDTVAQANASSDQKKANEQATITQTYNQLNQSVNDSNTNMTYQVNNLWNGVNAANATANAAMQASNAANAAANSSLTAANTANNLGYNAQQSALWAMNTANAAVAAANDANATANGALGTAGNAVNTATWANNTAWNAYNVAAAANSNANSAYGTAMGAYNSANSANAYAYAAYNAAGGLLDYANGVNSTAFYDITVAHSANVYAAGMYNNSTWALGMAQQAYNTPPTQVNQWSTSYDCGQMLGTGIACP